MVMEVLRREKGLGPFLFCFNLIFLFRFFFVKQLFFTRHVIKYVDYSFVT